MEQNNKNVHASGSAQSPQQYGNRSSHPVGESEYEVSQGECIASLARDSGHFWRTIWNDAANSELRRIRKNPNILLPGDRVHIPPIRSKAEQRDTGKRHSFVRLGEPAFIELCILRKRKIEDQTEAESVQAIVDQGDVEEEADFTLDQYSDLSIPEEESGITMPDGSEETAEEESLETEPCPVAAADEEEPRANEPYTLTIDGETFSGTTDAKGYLRVVVPGNARHGRLVIGRPGDRVAYELLLGGVDPVDALTGIQQRLTNLGLSCGSENGRMGPLTRAALQEFQRRHKLPDSGEPDEATRTKLLEVHGS
jgi:hypothetical protein